MGCGSVRCSVRVRRMRVRRVHGGLSCRPIELTQGLIDLPKIGNEGLSAHRSFGFDSRRLAGASDLGCSNHLGATAGAIVQSHQPVGVRSLFADVFRLIHQPVECGLKIATPVDAGGARSYAGALTW